MYQAFKRMAGSLYVRILFGFTTILLFSLFLGYGTLDGLRSVSDSIDGMSPRMENIETLAEMNSALEIIASRLSSSSETPKEEIDILVRRLESNLIDIRTSAVVLSEVEFSKLDDAVKAVAVAAPGLFTGEVRVDEFLGMLDDAQSAVDDAVRVVQEEAGVIIGNQRVLLTSAMRQLLTTQIIVLLLGMVLAMFLARTITSPIEILRESVRQVARGDYGAKVAVRSTGELGELAGAFNDMSEALKKYTTSLEGTVSERTKELNEKVDTLNSLAKELDESAVMLIRRDVALSRATERLQELDAVKSEFISVAAHQLRTPLSAIKWTLSLLLEGDAGPATPDQMELYRKAMQSNERMIRLIDDMLTVTRIESGKATFVTAPVSPGDALASVVMEVAVGAKDKGVRMSLQEVPQHRMVLADVEKLRLAFQNLLENAVRYTPKGGKITAALEQKANVVEITIADTGIGIPEHQRANIFSKFFRADNAVKAVTDGTGLGLYVAKTVIERHRGTLRFESEEGKGTTFFITLPNENAPFIGNI